MTTLPFPQLPPETIPPTKLRSWARVTQTVLGAFILSGAFVLMLAVLIGVAPLFVGLHPFVIISGSMEPTIHTGSVVLARTVSPSDLHVGDVIAFNPHANAALPIVHRIVALTERNGTRYATTRGDANTGDDAEMALTGPVLKVDMAIPLVGYAVYYAAQPIGTLVLIWIPLSLLIGLWVKDRVSVVYQRIRAHRA